MIILCVNFYDFGVESFCRIWCTVGVLYPYYGIINKNTQGQDKHAPFAILWTEVESAFSSCSSSFAKIISASVFRSFALCGNNASSVSKSPASICCSRN